MDDRGVPVGEANRVREVAGALAELLPAARDATIVDLARAARVRRFVPREILCHQGKALTVVLVLDGVVAARRTSAAGQVLTLVLLAGGDIFGLQEVSGSVGSAFDLVAVTPGRAATWRGSQVAPVLRRRRRTGARPV